MKSYEVTFEIEGPAAMFARPDTGAAPISYPVPTWSACKAMFESVARGFFAKGKTAAFFSATSIEILKPIRFEKYVTNYRGPLRIPDKIKNGHSYQLPATIVVDACYRIHGECLRIPGIPDESNNAPHALKEMFERRLQEGRSKYAPSLGWKEFVPNYFGPERPPTESCILQETCTFSIPGFLLSVWDAPVEGKYAPSFCEAMVEGGKLELPMAYIKNGKLQFGKGVADAR